LDEEKMSGVRIHRSAARSQQFGCRLRIEHAETNRASAFREDEVAAIAQKLRPLLAADRA
jgi:hypothetical protein